MLTCDNRFCKLCAPKRAESSFVKAVKLELAHREGERSQVEQGKQQVLTYVREHNTEPGILRGMATLYPLGSLKQQAITAAAAELWPSSSDDYSSGANVGFFDDH